MVVRDFAAAPDMSLSRDQLAFLVLKARAFDAEVDAVDPDDGSNAADDHGVSALEDTRDNPSAAELRGAIAALNTDAQTDLVALLWVGRGDYDADEWNDARTAALDAREGPTSRYLLGTPMLGDLLEEGAAKLGLNITQEEQIGLHHPATEQPAEDDRD